MLTKSLLTATAIVLAAGLGSASATEDFTTLEGISAPVMSELEMVSTHGSRAVFILLVSNFGFGNLGVPIGEGLGSVDQNALTGTFTAGGLGEGVVDCFSCGG